MVARAPAPAPTYTVWSLNETLIEIKPTFKQRVRKGDYTGNAYTLRKDIREWMKACVSDHWYLREDRVRSDSTPHNAGWGTLVMPVSITCEIFIHFRSQRDAVLFKLTWL